MIERLYMERVAEGVYDVVCNDLYTVAAPPPSVLNGYDMMGIEIAIEVMTNSHRDECEYADDIAGVRVGYKALDLLGVAYGGDVRVVPAFQLLRTIERLTAVSE